MREFRKARDLRERPREHPTWFELDGNDVLANTTRERAKGRNLARDPLRALPLTARGIDLVHDLVHSLAMSVNVHEAKTHFSKLLERVALGEEVVIARAGHPVAKLVPIAPDVAQRHPGSARGDVWVGDDFDAPLPDDELSGFE